VTELLKVKATEAFCTFTSTALLVTFQLRKHALIHSYTLTRLQSHMVPFAGTMHTPIPIAADATYRIEPEGYNGFDGDIWRHQWLPQLKPVAAGQLRLLTVRFSPDHTFMMAPFQWPPLLDISSLPPEEPVTIKCPVTFLGNVTIARSRFGRPLWTSENPKKNIAWIYWAIRKNTLWTSFVRRDRRHVRRIAFADAGSVHSTPETGQKSKDHDGTVGVCFTTEYPPWLDKHGDVLSMDMDDANGRLIMSMEDGALVVMEFV
jgi:hypothetical protein